MPFTKILGPAVFIAGLLFAVLCAGRTESGQSLHRVKEQFARALRIAAVTEPGRRRRGGAVRAAMLAGTMFCFALALGSALETRTHAITVSEEQAGDVLAFSTSTSDRDGDGVSNGSDNCPDWTNPAQTLPPWTVAANDPDCDGFSSSVENSANTNHLVHCGHEAWPADINNNGFSDISDVSALSARFGVSVPPAPPRQNFAPDPVDRFVDISDLSKLIQFFSQGCTSTGGGTPPSPPTPTPTPPPVAGSGITYYVDDTAGNDSNNGRSPAAAWRTLNKASSANLSPGDLLLLKRGGVWSGTLTVSQSGTPAAPIAVAAYGSGSLPLIEGGGPCVNLTGSRIVLTQLHADNCAWAGVRLGAGATFNRIEGNVMSGNVAGVHVNSGASDNQVIGNTIRDNNKMSVLTPGGDNDSGAFGVLLNGDRTEVAHNAISGHDAFSYDYGRDGAAVEVYGGQGNHVHHNLAVDNDAFSELGNSRSRDNTFAYNVVRSSLTNSIFVVTRGGQSGYGPVLNTRLLNNTVLMTGSGTQGFVCHAGCNSSVLSMRNNIIQAVAKAGYADSAFDEDYNLYSGGQLQFSTGPNTIVANPVFVSAAAGDLRLAANSRAVDSGVNTGYGADFEGARVPHDGNGDGLAVPDRGAFERRP